MTGLCSELIENILGHCLEDIQDPVGRSTLRSCLLVSRRFYGEALRHLVAHIPIHLDAPRAPEILASLARTLILNKYLIAGVKSLSFIWSTPALDHSASEWRTVIPLFEILKEISHQIMHLSFLYASSKSRKGVRTVPCGFVVAAILDLRIRCSSLATLTIHNLKIHPLFLWAAGSPQRLPRLTFDNSELWHERDHRDHLSLLEANITDFGSSELAQALSEVDDEYLSPVPASRVAEEMVVCGQRSVLSLCTRSFERGPSTIRLPNVRVFDLSLVGAHNDNNFHDRWSLKIRSRSLKEIKLTVSDRVDLSLLRLIHLPAVEYVHFDFSTNVKRLLHKSTVEDRVELAQRITNFFSTADDANIISTITIAWEWSSDQYLNLFPVSAPLDPFSKYVFPFDNVFANVKFVRLQQLGFFFAVYGHCDIQQNPADIRSSQRLGLAICPKLLSLGQVLVKCEVAWPSSESNDCASVAR